MTLAGVFKENNRMKIRVTSKNAFILRRARASADEATNIPVEGLCGAPVVHQEEDDDDVLSGGCIGFFRRSNSLLSVVAAVDQLMDAGWQIV
jgi:hypothetical protein